MNTNSIKAIAASLLILCVSSLWADAKVKSEDSSDQEAAESKSSDKKGWLTASFETNTILYHQDKKTSATVPDSKFGSNNYLKLDYYNNRFGSYLLGPCRGALSDAQETYSFKRSRYRNFAGFCQLAEKH